MKAPPETVFVGRAGTVEWMPMPEGTGEWREECHMGSWLCDCPGQSPGWRHYVLTGVHLRDVAGQERPPEKRTPECTHEIIVLALEPEVPPPTADMLMHGRKWMPLSPPNILMQIEDTTDDECRELLSLLARGVAMGTLPAEPPFTDPHHSPWWRNAIDDTLQHIKLGGHPKGHA